MESSLSRSPRRSTQGHTGGRATCPYITFHAETTAVYTAPGSYERQPKYYPPDLRTPSGRTPPRYTSKGALGPRPHEPQNTVEYCYGSDRWVREAVHLPDALVAQIREPTSTTRSTPFSYTAQRQTNCTERSLRNTPWLVHHH